MNARWQYLRVAITGMNNRPDNPGPGHATARCLHTLEEFQGEIIGLGYDVLDGGLYDRQICHSGHLLPYPSSGEQALLERLRQIHAEQPFDVLIPCLDSEMIAFSRLAAELHEMGIALLIPSQHMIERRDKDRLPELCALLGLSTPPIRHLTHAGFFLDCAQEGWNYPLVVKGRFYDASIVHNATQAQAAFQRMAHEWGLPVLVQQYIEGHEFNVCAVGDGLGGILGLVMMRKRALTEKGKAWAGTTIEHPQLEQSARKLVMALKWPGPLEIEMICDGKGQFHILEINPRFPAWVFLTHGAGCNLPQRLLQHLCQSPVASDRAKAGTTFIRYAEERIVQLDDLATMTLQGQLIHSSAATFQESLA